MATITRQSNNLSSCSCNGSHWLVCYDDSSNLCLKGQHNGQIMLNGTIEYYDTEQEMNDRIAALSLDEGRYD